MGNRMKDLVDIDVAAKLGSHGHESVLSVLIALPHVSYFKALAASGPPIWLIVNDLCGRKKLLKQSRV